MRSKAIESGLNQFSRIVRGYRQADILLNHIARLVCAETGGVGKDNQLSGTGLPLPKSAGAFAGKICHCLFQERMIGNALVGKATTGAEAALQRQLFQLNAGCTSQLFPGAQPGDGELPFHPVCPLLREIPCRGDTRCGQSLPHASPNAPHVTNIKKPKCLGLSLCRVDYCHTLIAGILLGELARYLR